MSSLLPSGVSEDSNGWTTVWALTLSLIAMGGVGCIIGAILYFYIIYRCRHRGREVISMKEREQVEEMLEMKNMSEGEDPDENTKSFYVI